MHVIGLGSTAQVGKDTIAEYLEKKYPLEGPGPYKVKRVAFADKLKEVAMDLFDLTHEQCYGPKEIKEAVDSRYNKSPRQILQELGEKLRRHFHESVWVDAVFLSTIPALAEKGYNVFVVSDVRYPNEADKIRESSGTVVRVTRPNSGTSVGADHISEKAMLDYPNFDFHLENDGSLQELYAKVDVMMEEIDGRKKGGNDH